jgi:dynactin 1
VVARFLLLPPSPTLLLCYTTNDYQEISQAEKAELLRRQRELERDLSHAEQGASSVQELRSWKAAKEAELSELREMVEVGHAYESMVESLSSKNLELEQKLSDLRVSMAEMEVAQELSEELEAQQAEEAAALRKELEKMGVVLVDKDGALRQSEARLLDREKTLQRFRALVTQLTAERDELREKAEARAAALGEARGRAQDVLTQVQSLRSSAKNARSRQVGQ